MYLDLADLEKKRVQQRLINDMKKKIQVYENRGILGLEDMEDE